MLGRRSVFVKTTTCAGGRATWTRKHRKTELGISVLVEFQSSTVMEMRRRQFASWMKLAVEANGVIALRTIKLMRGGRSARREAELMVSEKIHAAVEAAAAGASGNQIVHRYRQHV